MLRPSIPDDANALLAIAEAIGFQPSELALLSNLLFDFLQCHADDRFWVTDTDDDNRPVGVAYCEAERMTDQTWNLQLIAIQPNHQGQGRGTLLLRYVEQTLFTRGGRMLLVETSGLSSFARTRSFYEKSGYQKEACIRDFYTDGEDKVVFRKLLTPD